MEKCVQEFFGEKSVWKVVFCEKSEWKVVLITKGVKRFTCVKRCEKELEQDRHVLIN